MAIVGKKSGPTTLLQKFRVLTEGLLMEVAQQAMLGQYPNTGRSPYPKQGLIYTLLRLFFLPGFKLTPGRCYGLTLFVTNSSRAGLSIPGPGPKQTFRVFKT